MTISDIITLVSLVIAIVAIISEKNRTHLLLKFHLVDYLLFATAFTLINYFVFYESFYSREIFFSSLYFKSFGLKNPHNYAYLIAIVTLIYFLYKIWFAFYPFSQRGKVIKFYKQLIEINEISFLLDLIDRYHKKDIIKLVQRAPDFNKEDDSWWRERYRRVTLKEKINRWCTRVVQFLFPYSFLNRRSYGVLVLHRVINDPAFISFASNQRPYLFAEIFAQFKKIKKGAFPTELVNSFLTELIKHKNFWLKKELQQSQNHDFGQPDGFHDENKILSSLLIDLSVADVNDVWKPFGELAIHEIEEERTKGYESKMFQVFREEQFLWIYETYFSIQFFKIMISEGLNKKYNDSHFWLYYYQHITNAILKTYERFPPVDIEEAETVYHEFIELMTGNLFLWLQISNDKADVWFYNNILDCLGDIILSVCRSPHFNEKGKVGYIDRLMNVYCGLKVNSQTQELREKIGETLVKPSALVEDQDVYYGYIEQAWDKFDKIPHRAGGGLGQDLAYFTELKEKVIVPLGLDPDIQF